MSCCRRRRFVRKEEELKHCSRQRVSSRPRSRKRLLTCCNVTISLGSRTSLVSDESQMFWHTNSELSGRLSQREGSECPPCGQTAVMVVPGAFRTWKLIEDGGPGERGWLAAQGVLLTVQQPPGIRTPCHASPARDSVQHQKNSQEQEQVLSSFNTNSIKLQRKQRYRLVALLHSLFPRAMTAWSQTPARPIQA
jgi:hypothetical protein